MDHFVPEEFLVPTSFASNRFRLEPLSPEHNQSDYAAWSGSMDHIHRTPGFTQTPENSDPWPYPMSLEQNKADLEMHAADFRNRVGFTYTVIDQRSDQIVGCLYIYPDVKDDSVDAKVRSWVTAELAELDLELAATVQRWLDDAWPFDVVRYR
jgi:hypothetical protein